MNDTKETVDLSRFVTEILSVNGNEGNEGNDKKSLLEAVKIDFNKENPKPPVVLSVYDSCISTLGNFSLIIGKAKARKTFFVSMIVAALCRSNNILNGTLPPEKNVIILFDTEQSEYHVSKMANRILRLIGHIPDNLIVYYLRKYTPQERLALIEYAIENTQNLGFVVIDGIKDLVTSINDEEQATTTASKLLKWTDEKQIHILNVLHQNKADNNARGHLGTELVNKAETVLSITKDSNNDSISIVEAEYCRDKEPQPLAFEINDDGLPCINIDWCKADKKGKKTVAPDDIPQTTHINILSKVFSKEAKQKYNELVFNIKSEFKKAGTSFGDNKSKDFIQYYLSETILKKTEISYNKTYYEFERNYNIPFSD